MLNHTTENIVSHPQTLTTSLNALKSQSAVGLIFVASLLSTAYLQAHESVSIVVPAEPTNEAVVAHTSLGKLQGVADEGVLHFRGVRYAEAPTGERRFAPPAPANSWEGLKEATEFPNRCMQADTPFFGEPVGSLNEDCLFLNIVTPSLEGDKRPVMFWIHGGSLMTGSANEYNGSELARQGDIVVVTINYRLGLWGFLDLSDLSQEYAGSGSNGFRDQVLALQWVKDHIADFGGDPNNVTIFGESAGGFSVLALLATPSADGLYHKAIAHSPTIASGPTPKVLPSILEQTGEESETIVDSLRSKTATEMLQLQASIEGIGGGVDGVVVTRSTVEAIKEREANGVPLISGSNLHEGKLFLAIYALMGPDFQLPNEGIASMVMNGNDPTAYIEGLRALHPEMNETEIHERIWDALFRKAAIQSTQQATEFGAGGWLYQFNLLATEKFLGQDVGATHAAEISFTFNRYNSEEPGFLLFNDPDDPVIRDLSQKWSDTLITFAKTGDPNGAGLPEWPRYDGESRKTLVLDRVSKIESDLNSEERLLWENAEYGE